MIDKPWQRAVRLLASPGFAYLMLTGCWCATLARHPKAVSYLPN